MGGGERLRAPAHAAACLALVLASGCTWLTPPALEEPLRRPAPAGERTRVERWVEQLRIEASTRRSIRAYARVRIETPSGNARVREVIAAARPSRLRVETLNFLGQAQSLLVSDAQSSSFYDGRQLLRDEPPELMLARLGLDLAPAEAIDLLLADPAVPPGAPVSVWLEGRDRVAEYPGRSLRWSESGELVGLIARDPDDAVRLRVEFGRWSDVDGGRYPLELSADFPRTELRAEFQVEDVALNTELEPSLFRLPTDSE